MSVAASLGIQGLNMISGVLIARLLGPTGKGQLTAVLLWPGLLVAVGSLGLGSAVVYFTARAAGRERDISATAFAIVLVESGALVAVGLLMTSHVLGHYGPHIVAIGLLNLTWIPPYLLATAALSVLQGRFELQAFNLLRLSATAASVAALLGLALANQLSVLTVVLVTLGANFLNLALCFSVLGRRGWIGFRPKANLVRPLMVYGLKSYSGNMAGLINASADQAIIALFLAPAALGLYSIAVTLTALIGLLTSSLGLVAFPAVAGTKSHAERLRQLSEFVRASLVMSALVAVALALAAPFLIRLFFGPGFAPATPVAQVLLLAAVFLGMNRVLGEAVRGFNKPLIPGLAEGIAAVVTLASLAALLPLLGIMGAAIASLLAYGTSLAYMVWFCASRLEISPAMLFVPRRSDWIFVRNQLTRRWRGIDRVSRQRG
jgi:O-antigen/teichoic acid export membrane protein